MKLQDLIEQSTDPDDIAMHEEQLWFTSEPCTDLSIALEDRLIHEEPIDLYEMANLSSQETGIKGIIVWVNGGVDKLQHGPRIKVVKGNKYRNHMSSTIPLTGVPKALGNANLSQDDFANIVTWMNLNRELLLAYGNDELSTMQFLTQLKKI